jgi:hypothetical protein
VVSVQLYISRKQHQPVSIKTHLVSSQWRRKTKTVFNLLEGTALTACLKQRKRVKMEKLLRLASRVLVIYFLFIAYLLTLSIDQTTLYNRMVWWLVNNELEICRRKRSWSNLRHNSGIWQGGLRKTKKSSVSTVEFSAEIVPNTFRMQVCYCFRQCAQSLVVKKGTRYCCCSRKL